MDGSVRARAHTHVHPGTQTHAGEELLAKLRSGAPGFNGTPEGRYCCTGLIGATVINHFLFNKLPVGLFSPCSYWIVVFYSLILGSFFYIMNMHIWKKKYVLQISFPESWLVWPFPFYNSQ